MSGYTPTAMSWSTDRNASTATPFFSMIAVEMSINPCVWESSGVFFSVQFRNRALRSEKSHWLVSHISTCRSLSMATSPRPWLVNRFSLSFLNPSGLFPAYRCPGSWWSPLDRSTINFSLCMSRIV